MSRKRRPGEVVCLCGAYKFPHRMMGGECVGGLFVHVTFEQQQYGSCRDCPYREEVEGEGFVCQVLNGKEPTRECPALQEFIAYEEIMLYGVNAPPKKGPLRFRR